MMENKAEGILYNLRELTKGIYDIEILVVVNVEAQLKDSKIEFMKKNMTHSIKFIKRDNRVHKFTVCSLMDLLSSGIELECCDNEVLIQDTERELLHLLNLIAPDKDVDLSYVEEKELTYLNLNGYFRAESNHKFYSRNNEITIDHMSKNHFIGGVNVLGFTHDFSRSALGYNDNSVTQTLSEVCKLSNYKEVEIDRSRDYDILLTSLAFSDLLTITLSTRMNNKSKIFLSNPKMNSLLSINERQEGFYLYDSEGIKRKSYNIIKDGKINKLPGNTYQNGILDRESSTGNNYKSGIQITSMNITSGRTMLNQIIKSIKHGLIINKLHYFNVFDCESLNFSCYTGDSVLVIENGMVIGFIKDLHIEDNVMGILESIKEISSEKNKIPNYSLHNDVPSVLLSKLNYTIHRN